MSWKYRKSSVKKNVSHRAIWFRIIPPVEICLRITIILHLLAFCITLVLMVAANEMQEQKDSSRNLLDEFQKKSSATTALMNS